MLKCIPSHRLKRSRHSSPGRVNVGDKNTPSVVFLSCPLVKKHADLSGSFLYSQSTMKDMYSKPANRTELSNSNEDKEHCVATLYIYEPKNVREKETTGMFLNS